MTVFADIHTDLLAAAAGVGATRMTASMVRAAATHQISLAERRLR